jgi:hypothetical protein
VRQNRFAIVARADRVDRAPQQELGLGARQAPRIKRQHLWPRRRIDRHYGDKIHCFSKFVPRCAQRRAPNGLGNCQRVLEQQLKQLVR